MKTRRYAPWPSAAALLWLLALAFFLVSCASPSESELLRLSGVWLSELGPEFAARNEEGLPAMPTSPAFHANIAREGKGRLMLDFYDGRSYEIAGLRRLGENEYALRLSRIRAAEGLASPRRAVLRLRFLDKARAELGDEAGAKGLLGREGVIAIRKLFGPGLQ